MPATITVQDQGGGEFLLTIAETLANNASEVAIELALYGLPLQFEVLEQSCDLQAGGTGTTVDPILTRAAGSTLATDVMVENAAASANAKNASASGPVPCRANSAYIYHRSRPNHVNLDHTITTTYKLRRGWSR